MPNNSLERALVHRERTVLEMIACSPMRNGGRVGHPTNPGTVTVAGKPSLDIPPGTLNSVLKQAALKK